MRPWCLFPGLAAHTVLQPKPESPGLLMEFLPRAETLLTWVLGPLRSWEPPASLPTGSQGSSFSVQFSVSLCPPVSTPARGSGSPGDPRAPVEWEESAGHALPGPQRGASPYSAVLTNPQQLRWAYRPLLLGCGTTSPFLSASQRLGASEKQRQNPDHTDRPGSCRNKFPPKIAGGRPREGPRKEEADGLSRSTEEKFLEG